MELKEKIAYLLGLVLVVYAAFVGKDLSSGGEVLGGVVFLVFFFSIFLLFMYMNSRGIGDWHRKYN